MQALLWKAISSHIAACSVLKPTRAEVHAEFEASAFISIFSPESFDWIIISIIAVRLCFWSRALYSALKLYLPVE